MISEQAFIDAAELLNCEVAAVKAVEEIESNGNPFNSNGEPTILFERHVFHKLTGGKFDKTHPHLSNRTPGGYGAKSYQHMRLQEAAKLDRDAALQSASWGAFQIMGFNYKAAGFDTLQAFINAMYKNEEEHLKAFINFVKSQGLDKYLREKNWAAFAKGYNGPAYASHGYHTKLAAAYEKYSKG